jgi:hypothetical protein
MMNAKLLIAAVFALPLAAYAGGDKASSGSTASASASTDATEMFKALDKNNDGFISREEAKGSPHEKEFDKLDKNGDGKLSREEHAAAHKAQASTGGTKSDSGSAAAASSAPTAAPAVGPAQSSSDRTAEPQPSAPAAPTGEKKY